jgi:hypothetical protein
VARIRTYEQELGTAADIPGRRMQPQYGAGEALITAGEQTQRIAGFMQEAEARQEVSDVHAKLAKARGDWTVYLTERAREMKPGDTGFADKFREDFDSYLGLIQGNLKTRAGQQAFERVSAGLAADFVSRAAVHQSNSVGTKAVQDYNVALDSFRNALVNDPTQFNTAQDQAIAALNDPSGYFAQIPPAKRAELEVQTRKQLALSAVQGTIRLGPEIAKGQLNQGVWDNVIDADHKVALLKDADEAIHVKEQGVKTQKALEEAERKKAFEAEKDRFMQRIIRPTKQNGGMPSDAEITDSKLLDSGDRRELADYKLSRAKAMKEDGPPKTNPKAVLDFVTRMDAPDDDPKKLVNKEEVRQAALRHEINAHEYDYLSERLDKTTDGSTTSLRARVAQARNTVRDAFTRSIAGSVNPEVAVAASYRYAMDLDAAVAEARKKGEEPRATVLNPNVKGSMLDPAVIATYMPTAREAQAQAAGKAKAAETPAPKSKYEVGKVYEFAQGAAKFKGGDPQSPASWEPIKSKPIGGPK